MAQVVVAPNQYPHEGFKVYLAGAIDMGDAENWQQDVISRFAGIEEMVLLNPRRSKFTDAMEQAQIEWELEAMDDADLIFMWFPKESEAPISLLEMGLYLRSGKLLLGVEVGYYRQRNIELTARRYNVTVFYSLDDLVQQVKNRLNQST